MPMFSGCRGRLWFSLGIALLLGSVATLAPVFAAGEPAKEFINQLRAAKYFDTALAYLDRLDEYPGVDSEFMSAIALEKAQTHIQQAVSSRNSKKRDEYFLLAEEQITDFLKQVGHPRLSEARLKLGKLQFARATQLMAGEPDDTKRKEALASYMAAAKTFDEIVETLRVTLKGMQGAKVVDSAQKKLRDRYRGEFLQAMNSLAEARRLAASTLPDPAKDGKELLDQALQSFIELSEKYGGYAQGAMATLQRGQVEEQLGKKVEALDSYMRMLEQPDADALRDAKFQAANGIIRLSLEKAPPEYQRGIERGRPVLDGARPNERTASSVQDLRIALAKAYLRRSEDSEKIKPAEKKQAKSDKDEGRKLLNLASKIPSPQAEEAIKMLAKIGIDREAPVAVPKAEQPESLQDAWDEARELQAAIEQNEAALALLQEAPTTPETRAQIGKVTEQLAISRSLASQYLQRGLAVVDSETELELINQSRQFLAYLLHKSEHFRDAYVVGFFLARNAPGSETGLAGGLVALNSLLLIRQEDPGNVTANEQLVSLADFLLKFWPNNPNSAMAQGVIIKIGLEEGRYDDAEARIAAMPNGAERWKYQRLLGFFLWNEYVGVRDKGDEKLADDYLLRAEQQLSQGLSSMQGKLIGVEVGQAALVLVRIYLRQGKITEVSEVLDNDVYGPVKLIARLGAGNQAFASDVYGVELQVLVQRMALEPVQADALLKRATAVMDKLHLNVQGPDAQKKLTNLYMRISLEIREQLDLAVGDAKGALISAFRTFLEQIAKTTKDETTLLWVAKSLMDLAEASMPSGENKATGQAAGLLETAVTILDLLKTIADELPLSVHFQLAKANRLLGNYKDSINAYAALLAEKPMMLDAQMEAAFAYEQWAAIVPEKYTAAAYKKALTGGKPDAQGKNIIWGWGKVSQLTSRDPKYKDMFFKARYHLALCRYRDGKTTSDTAKMEKAVTDITKVHALYPAMGGPDHYKKFNSLLKLIQTQLRQSPKGLSPTPEAVK